MNKIKIAAAILFGCIALVRGDETIAKAQQALKDEGFYYGQVTGEKDTDTTAAIRRFQIRNGLHVSGDLDSETVHALVGATPPSTRPEFRNSPSPTPTLPPENDEQEDTRTSPYPPAEPQDRQTYPDRPRAAMAPSRGLFTGTPYEAAPPEVQRNIIASAQKVLARRDLYNADIDGIFGPDTEFSLRAYQARLRLPITGRLDLDTLAALNLLPGRRAPGFVPRRRVMPAFPQPPIRGEWVPEP